MTTIVYDHKNKLIATDGRISCGGVISTDQAEKRIVKEEVAFYFCGKVCDEQLFMEGFFGKKITEVPECRALVVDGLTAYLCEFNNDCILEKCPLTYNESIGSGREFALSAMDFGKNAKEAVEYACTRDLYSGGLIRVYEV